MKYYAGIIIAILILIGGYFVFTQNSTVTTTKTVKVTREPIALSMIKKTVYHYASSTKQEVTEPVAAYEGDEVETLADGRAIMQMVSGTVTTIDYSTKIKIQTHEGDEHTKVGLESGKVWSTVKKVFGKGEYYEIETQNAVAVVRGTSFGVSFDGKQTILEVTEGTVLLVPIDENGERLYDRAVLVPAGKKAIVDELGNITVSDLDSADKSREWFRFNNNVSDAADSQIKISDLKAQPKTSR